MFFKSCVKKIVLFPIQWRYAKEIYIPKSKTPSESNIKDFRPIALLNVEGKLLFSLISKRLEAHLIANNSFINTSIQKGCMEKVPRLLGTHVDRLVCTKKKLVRTSQTLLQFGLISPMPMEDLYHTN